MNKRNEPLGYEEVERRFKEKGLKLLTKEYKNNHQLLDCEDKWGYRYNPTINTLNNLNLTKMVYTLNKWSIYNINKYIENNNITSVLLTKDYKGSKVLMAFRCECGNVFHCCWDDFQGRNRHYCHKCALKYGTKRLDEKFIISEYKRNGLKILEGQNYKNMKEPLECITSDGYKIFKSYNNLKKDFKSSIFSYKYNKQNYVYNVNNYLKLNKISGECLEILDYKVSGHGQYYIKMKCECGKVYRSCIDYIKNGNYRCPSCSNVSSKGELEIKKILEEMDVNFIPQYKFSDCKYKRCLPFDFYLPDYRICIEYDGEQHFEICFSQSQEEFDTSIKRDKIKDDYCVKNNIKLIRIPYFEFKNIKRILKKQIPLKSNEL